MAFPNTTAKTGEVHDLGLHSNRTRRDFLKTESKSTGLHQSGDCYQAVLSQGSRQNSKAGLSIYRALRNQSVACMFFCEWATKL
jgi:anthranilate/para-aminobenzoate synthase component I